MSISVKQACLVVAFVALFGLSACSKLIPKLDTVIPDNRKSYQKAKSLPDLEIPPDLSTDAIQDQMAIPEGGRTARYSTYQERQAERQKEEELEKAADSAVQLLENEHVLAVQGAAIQIWPKLRTFWESRDYPLDLDDEELGVMETAWREDSENLVRDKFKLFAEPGQEAGTTLLYISHQGEELVPQGEDLVWQRRPRDVELEGKLVGILEEQMTGVRAERSSIAARPITPAASNPSAPAPQVSSGGPPHAELVSVGGGKVYLTVLENFPSAWKSTSRALELAGVEIEEADRGRGVFLVRVLAEEGGDKGMLKKLKFWGGDDASEYQISLTGVGDKTEVVVLDEDGQWETNDAAGRLLSQLQNVFNDGQI
ncbi:MAG: outer membrane protein assembly factor BamC [Pseudomonadota bacterium]